VRKNVKEDERKSNNSCAEAERIWTWPCELQYVRAGSPLDYWGSLTHLCCRRHSYTCLDVFCLFIVLSNCGN